MGEFITGAVVSKTTSGFAVQYQNQIVAEFKIRDLAVMFALDVARLEASLVSSNVYLLKAA